jgi:hypothetical protein
MKQTLLIALAITAVLGSSETTKPTDKNKVDPNDPADADKDTPAFAEDTYQ